MISLTRGTTPTVTCNIPEGIDLEDVSEIWFTFSQQSHEITHRLSDGEVAVVGQSIQTTLSQAETLQFNSNRPAECGIRFKTSSGAAWALAEPEPVRIHRIVKDGEI